MFPSSGAMQGEPYHGSPYFHSPRLAARTFQVNLCLMVEEKGLQQAVKIFQSGCLGGCEFGPVMMTVPDQKMYFQVGEDDLEELLAEMVKDLPEQPGLA